MVTRLAWMAHKLVSSNRPTRYASADSWRAKTADPWKRRSDLKSWAISRTNRWNGSLRIRRSVDFWYRRISRSATVPGLYRWGFLTPPVAGADLRAALVASCFLGALPVDHQKTATFTWGERTGVNSHKKNATAQKNATKKTGCVQMYVLGPYRLSTFLLFVLFEPWCWRDFDSFFFLFLLYWFQRNFVI